MEILFYITEYTHQYGEVERGVRGPDGPSYLSGTLVVQKGHQKATITKDIILDPGVLDELMEEVEKLKKSIE